MTNEEQKNRVNDSKSFHFSAGVCWRNYKEQKEHDKNYIYYLHVKIILRDEFGKLTSTSSVKEDGNRDLKSQFSKVTCKGEHR